MLISYFLSKKLKRLVATLIESTVVLVLALFFSLLGIEVFDWVMLDLIISKNYKIRNYVFSIHYKNLKNEEV